MNFCRWHYSYYLPLFLVQKGFSESKDPDKPEEVDRVPNPNRKDAPWSVKAGGFHTGIIQTLTRNCFTAIIYSFVSVTFLTEVLKLAE